VTVLLTLVVCCLQHGAQLYTGWGYGGIYSTNMLVLENYANGTKWRMEDTQFELFSHLVIDGQSKSTRGSNWDFLSCGRLFTYFAKDDLFGVDKGHYHYYAAFTPFVLAFPSFEPPFVTPLGVIFQPLLAAIGSSSRPRALQFAELSLRLLGQQPDERSHTHFYDSDYSAHHRPEYAVFVHSLSVHTEATECECGSRHT
jgi:hypothetical protein